MLLRKIGKLVLGKATPFQIVAAAVIGGALGFMPGSQAAGTIVALLVVLLVLNANLFVSALVGLAAMLASLPLTPVSFAVGRGLLDGPTQGVFEVLVNAPVTALLGLEYYVVTGGLVVGVLFGLALALPMVRGLGLLRARLARLEEGSERYKAFMAKWWVGPLMFLLLGVRRGKWSYHDLADRRVGLPIRPLGAAAALLLVGSVIVLLQLAGGPIVNAALRSGLERANGATVDIRTAELDLGESRLVLTGLAMADPNDLDSDLIRAARVEANVGGLELLRKRLVLDRVVLEEARTGEPREVPGRLVGRAPTPDDRPTVAIPDSERLEEYLQTARDWKERLAQLRRWLDKLAGPPDEEGDESLSDYVRRRVRELGYAQVRADHLIEGSPVLLIRELLAERVQSRRLPEGETLDVVARNISTHPSRVAEPPHVDVRSSRQTIEATVDLGAVTDASRPNELSWALRGIPVDRIAGQWRAQPAPMEGGTIDADARVTWTTGAAGAIDFPLNVTLRDTTISLPGAGSRQVARFELPVRVHGAFDDPRIAVDADTLARSLADAGAAELAAQVQERIDAETGRATDRLREEADRATGRVRDEADKLLGGLLGGKDKPKGDGQTSAEGGDDPR